MLEIIGVGRRLVSKFEWASPVAMAERLASREAELGLLEIPNEQKPRRFALPMLAAVISGACAVASIVMAAGAGEAGDATIAYALPEPATAVVIGNTSETSTSYAVATPGPTTTSGMMAAPLPSPAKDVGNACARTDVFVEFGGCKASRIDAYTVASAFFFVLAIVFITLGRRIFGR
jgi:hypothetical protein